MAKTLEFLVSSLGAFEIFGPKNFLVKGITDDSRKVKSGYLFVAIKGDTFDGHDFISKAAIGGAKVVVGEKDPKRLKLKGMTYVRVKSSRNALGLLASAWFGNPSDRIRIIGVTGTDGKTTTTNLIYWILKTAGKKVGLVSTINAKIGKEELDTGPHVTNPEPLLLHKLLAKMVKADCKFAVLEVTSHGLDQERVAGIPFEVAVLTNISHEHLDYHKTLDNYIKAKAKLFTNSKIAVLNKQDSSFNKIMDLIPRKVQVVGYDSNILKDFELVVFKRFPEKYNRYNAAASISVAKILKVKKRYIRRAIITFEQLAGRMEEVRNDRGIGIFVDFAHTPNALENVLKALKEKTSGRLITVLGCAGERDKQKRSMMGEISTRIADFSIFTAEDPRSESVEKIIGQMIKGAKKSRARQANIKNYRRLVYGTVNRKELIHYYASFLERGEAIAYAVQKLAKKGDTVIILGKGHEKSMAFGKIEYPWSDKEAVETALKGGIKLIKNK